MPFHPPTTAAKTEFLDALASWSGRALSEFPTSAPPVTATGSADEDAILAKVFAALAADAPFYAPTHSSALLTGAIVRYQRHIDMAWDAARSSKSGHVADRSAWRELRLYEQMVAVLHLWHEAIFDRTVGVAA